MASQETLTSTGAAERFPTAEGHMTRNMRHSYLEREINAGRLAADALFNEKITSLEASNDPASCLYFWQVYNLTGREPIMELSERFYTSLFADDDPDHEWFVLSFGRPDIRHHALFLGMALVDSFGGGGMYAGGDARLDDVHHAAARLVMSNQSAVRWAYHMRHALDEVQKSLDLVDSRIRPAMEEFMHFFMSRYAQIYDFDMTGVEFSSLGGKAVVS